MPKHPNWWKTNTDGWFPGGEGRQQGLSFLPLPRRAVWFRWAGEAVKAASVSRQAASFHVLSTWVVPHASWGSSQEDCGAPLKGIVARGEIQKPRAGQLLSKLSVWWKLEAWGLIRSNPSARLWNSLQSLETTGQKAV